ncbi:large ribosomal subunit protein bL28 [endosymbiont GvMRE of Glomus versiforme]|jgi:ribosomal protein L28|uniref:large ribosomal subunit protein bL28 n=1 Tax=endosymbiont GvMRE of Glomus versiforme TaxID=2039283 RepID=UPI000ED33988|nr:50S ribosomal protein L28 [endosymbiont GvMRE of Glomus versiforme]
MKKIEEKLKKILNAKNKPLVGNNRSFSMIATKRKFRGNIQKFKIGNKTYKIRVKDFRSLRSY